MNIYEGTILWQVTSPMPVFGLDRGFGSHHVEIFNTVLVVVTLNLVTLIFLF